MDKQTNNRRQSKTATSQTNRYETILLVCPVLQPGYVDYQNRRPHQNNDAARVYAGIVGLWRSQKLQNVGCWTGVLEPLWCISFPHTRRTGGMWEKVTLFHKQIRRYCQLPFLSGMYCFARVISTTTNTAWFDSGGLRLYFGVHTSL